MGFPHRPEKGVPEQWGVTFPHINQCCILSEFNFYFPLFPAAPRLQLVLYSDEEVRAALQPLRAIPTFTTLLLTDPPAAPKQKCDEPAGDPLLQSLPDVPAKKVVGGKEPLPAVNKPGGVVILQLLWCRWN